MNEYEAKRAAKAERFEELAAKHRKESTARYDRSRSMADMIPFGQPILVGHHSESGHRSHLAKIDTNMRKSIEHSDTADYYDNKADNARNNTAISSDDPEAVTKMKAKIEKHEELRTRIKLENSTARKNKTEQPHARYVLSNLSQNIGTMKKRLASLEKKATMETKEEQIGNVRMLHNVDDNRLQLFFPSKPDEETRTKLKSGGFRWSPLAGAWQRHLSNQAIWSAQRILA